jgi:hypothetical protein
MTYDRQILTLLSEAGQEGMSIALISRRLYNMNCSFFDTIDYDDIHKYVLSFVQKGNRSAQSLIEGTGKRGFYRIKTQLSETQQLMLNFIDEAKMDEQEEELPTDKDESLFLF